MRSWADDFNTYDEACHFYGCDTPAQLEAEAREDAARWALELAGLEAALGPYAPVPFQGERTLFSRAPLSQADLDVGGPFPMDDIPF